VKTSLAAREKELEELQFDSAALSRMFDLHLNATAFTRSWRDESDSLKGKLQTAHARAPALRSHVEQIRTKLNHLGHDLKEQEAHLEASRIRCELEVERATQLGRLQVN
jgi:hypothetical protein